MVTAIILFSYLLLLVASFLLWAWCLRWGLRWAKMERVTWRCVLIVTAVVTLIQCAVVIGLLYASTNNPLIADQLAIVKLLANVLIPVIVIMRFFKAPFFRSLQAWLPTLAGNVITVVLALFVLQPFIVEAFTSPTNAMAPTILGNHWRGSCLKCGNPAYCSPIPLEYRTSDPPTMICKDNFHIIQPTDYVGTTFAADNFLVTKFLKPKRWDVIAFHPPDEPTTIYAMRLVGLPGEEITIKEGHVWANGKQLIPPDAISGIRYQNEMEGWDQELWGSPARPAQLTEGEYFVLGDFSPQSRDSRLWEQTTAGHNPFAVPEANILGVITHTSWPPERWQVFR